MFTGQARRPTIINHNLPTLFEIRAGERRLVRLLFAHSLLNGWAQTATLSVAYSLFVESFGAQNLPYIFVGGALFTLLAGLLYDWLAQRIPFARLLTANLAVLLLGLLALRCGLDLPQATWVIVVLAIWFDPVSVFTDLEFWGLAGRLFDVRQAKRLFPPIGLGRLVALVAGGLAMPWLIGLIGTANLLLVAVAALAGSLVLLRLLVRESKPQFAAEPASPASERGRMSLGRLLCNRYVLLIFALMILYEYANFSTDMIFVGSAATRYPSAAELAGFLGLFGAVAGLGSLLMHSVVLTPLLARFGPAGSLLAWPLLVSLGSAAMVVSGLAAGPGTAFFWAAAATRLAERVLKSTTFQTSLQMLYQPLPPQQRMQVQNLNETIVDSLGVIVGSLSLLLLINLAALDYPWLAMIQLVLVLGVALVALALGRSYPVLLLAALKKKRCPAGEPALAARASITAMEESLPGPQPGQALAAQIAHPDDALRTQVLLTLSRAGYKAAGPAAALVTQQIKNEVAGAARCCAALVDLDGVAAAGELQQALDQRVAQARERVLLLLAFVYDGPTIRHAGDSLHDPSPHLRACALEVLDLQSGPQLRRLVMPLLENLTPRERLRRLPAAYAGSQTRADRQMVRIGAGDAADLPARDSTTFCA
jgi:ATP/ADP translocase